MSTLALYYYQRPLKSWILSSSTHTKNTLTYSPVAYYSPVKSNTHIFAPRVYLSSAKKSPHISSLAIDGPASTCYSITLKFW